MDQLLEWSHVSGPNLDLTNVVSLQKPRMGLLFLTFTYCVFARIFSQDPILTRECLSQVSFAFFNKCNEHASNT